MKPMETEDPRVLEQQLTEKLRTRSFGRPTYYFREIDSTSSCARVLAECGASEGTVVAAGYQTGGRGRQGRTWFSPQGESLLCSVVLRPKRPRGDLNTLPLVAAVALSRAVESVAGVSVRCKWPNDLLLGRRKFCGILVEGNLPGDGPGLAILGFGVNLCQESFPPELESRATSLLLEGWEHPDPVLLFGEIMLSLEETYAEFCADGFGGLLPRWLARASPPGTSLCVVQGERSCAGDFSGLSPEGGLMLETTEGPRVFFAGDVSLVEP
ncbi:MAG: biotin--[acetyl-CoA-carboxylase] ligase [Bacteroidota bacterium]